MTKTFTRNDVIRYVYDEMTDEESAFFKSILKVDSELREDCQAELQIKDQMSRAIINPPARVIDALLNYSMVSPMRESKITG